MGGVGPPRGIGVSSSIATILKSLLIITLNADSLPGPIPLTITLSSPISKLLLTFSTIISAAFALA